MNDREILQQAARINGKKSHVIQIAKYGGEEAYRKEMKRRASLKRSKKKK